MFGKIRVAFGGYVIKGAGPAAPVPPGDFCLGKSHQNRFPPKAADPFPTRLAGLGARPTRRARTTRLGLKHGIRDNPAAGYAAPAGGTRRGQSHGLR